MSTEERLYDVIIVGAGLAGLSAAHQLVLAGKNVLVLEGANRTGGRILTQMVDGLAIDIGAQWINPNYQQVIELCQLFGLNIEKRKSEGLNFYLTNGRKSYFTGLYPQNKIADKINTSRLVNSLDKLKILEPEKPWLSRSAGKLDQQRFSLYLKQKSLSTKYYNMIRNIFESRFLNGINQVSTLEAVNNWQASTSMEKWKIVGGTEQLIKKLSQEVDVEYEQPVKSIVREGNLLRLNCPHMTFRCRKAIVAVPPPQASQIRYEPAPGISREKIWESAEAGRIIKSILVFDASYWKNNQWSGEAFLSDDYVMNSIMDTGSDRDTYGILTTHSVGARCLKLESLNEMERKDVILQQLSSVLNLPAGIKPVHYIIHDWKVPPNGPGAYHIFPPGTLTTFREFMDQKDGLIYWAAAEYDHLFRGSMEGAVRSGRRAADQILGYQSL